MDVSARAESELALPLPCCPAQALSGLDDAYPQRRATCFSPPIQMLISSRDPLTDTPRNNVLPALRASLSPATLAHNSNHQRSVLELRQPTFKGGDHRPCRPGEDAQHRTMRMHEMDYIQYGHSQNPICPVRRNSATPASPSSRLPGSCALRGTRLFRDYQTRALSPGLWGPSSAFSNLHQSGHGMLMNGGYA